MKNFFSMLRKNVFLLGKHVARKACRIPARALNIFNLLCLYVNAEGQISLKEKLHYNSHCLPGMRLSRLLIKIDRWNFPRIFPVPISIQKRIYLDLKIHRQSVRHKYLFCLRFSYFVLLFALVKCRFFSHKEEYSENSN